MKLIHTSASEITEITSTGRFGSFLFFSTQEYVTTAAEQHIVYSIEIEESSIIEASQLFYAENAALLDSMIDRVANQFGVDSDVAESLIEGSVDITDIESNVDVEDLGEASWDIQKYTADAAKILGFNCVSVRDEQGTAYMIDMLTHKFSN